MMQKKHIGEVLDIFFALINILKCYLYMEIYHG